MENLRNEDVKIESINNYLEKMKKIILIAGIITVISFILFNISKNIAYSHIDYYVYSYSYSYPYSSNYEIDYEERDKFYFWNNIRNITLSAFVISGTVLLISGVFGLYSAKMKMVVTDKRIYGKAHFGKQVDLPLDSISAISKKWLKGISVATSSGRIGFILISNRDEMYKIISELLIERQEKREAEKTKAKVINNSVSSAEELKQFKELLDSGAITQEEFNAKKKQLLGL